METWGTPEKFEEGRMGTTHVEGVRVPSIKGGEDGPHSCKISGCKPRVKKTGDSPAKKGK